MNTKLTLTIDQSIIEKAKRYARKKERSLSDLVENYLKALVSSNDNDDKTNELTPTVKALKGSFKMSKDFDYKKELTDRLSEKHLK
jgi:replicative DNA helicase